MTKTTNFRRHVEYGRKIRDLFCEIDSKGRCTCLIAVWPVHLAPIIQRSFKKNIGILFNKKVEKGILDCVKKLETSPHLRVYDCEFGDVSSSYHILLSRNGKNNFFISITNVGAKQVTESEERYRLMVDHVKDYAIFMLDLEGNVTTWNEGAERMFGYRENEILNTHFSRFYPKDNSSKLKPQDELRIARREGRAEVEGLRRRKDGTLFWAGGIVAPVYDESKEIRGFSKIIRDISDRKETELMLKERTRDLEITKAGIELEKAQDEALLNSIGEGVVATDNQGRIMFMNKQAEEMFGVQEESAQRKFFFEVWRTLNERGEVVSPIQCPIAIVLKTGKKSIHTDYYYSTHYKKKFPAASTASPVVLSGRIVGAIIVFRDIHKEKEIDQAKSEFVSLASHQLRTPLTAIKLFVEMLNDGHMGNLNPDQKEALQSIQESNQKMIHLVENLLNVSRIETGKLKIELKEILLQDLVKKILYSSELTPQLKETKLKFKALKTLLPIVTDPILLTQVINNLVTNAIEYSKSHDSKVEIDVGKWNTKNYYITVKDNGIGIPKDAHKKVFQRLYRASNAIKKRTDGNGLGLYMSKMIIEALGGKIWLTSKVGEGTTFYILLPVEK